MVVGCSVQPRAEHVFVTDGPEPAPGLLLGWRQRAQDGRWEGWVVVARLLPSGEVDVRQNWVRAESIRRLE